MYSMNKNLMLIATTLLGAGVTTATAITEQQWQDDGEHKLQRFMAEEGHKGVLQTADGQSVYYQRFDERCNGTAIVVIPGWSEPYFKYAEVIFDLHQQGFCVYAYDHRGQGLSSRSLDDSQIGHVDDFYNYVNDLASFDRQIVRAKPHQQVYLLGHSMGGLVASLYAAKTHATLDGVILTAPMFSIDTGAWPQWAAYTVVTLMDWFGFGDAYVLGHGPWQETPFESNRLSHSRSRYEYGTALFRNNDNLIVAGVSNRWLKTSMDYAGRFDSIAPSIDTKVLMFQAGNDSFVPPQEQNDFCDRVPQCDKVVFPQAKHEMLMETDSIRDVVLEKILTFIQTDVTVTTKPH